MKESAGEKNIMASFIVTALYSALSIAYFSFMDPNSYFKNILNCGISLWNPIPYVMLTALYVYILVFVMKEKALKPAYPAVAMAFILPLFYLLAEMKIGMLHVNPFKGNRALYGAYSEAYFTLLMSLFCIATGAIFNRSHKRESVILHLPIFAYLVYIEGMLFLNGLRLYAIFFAALFFISLVFGRFFAALKNVKGHLSALARNEKFFLIAIYAAAFLIRYFWGARLSHITGSNFTIASDDGICYDDYASILAGGRLLPHESLYLVSGFSYWYFLAAIYKIFGLHNFKAMFLIQSLIGASVPVMTYYIGRKAFRAKAVAMIAAVFTAIDMNLIFLSVVIGMEAIYIPLLTFALLGAVYLIDSRRFGGMKAFAAGSLFGIAYTARPPELIFFPFVLGAVVFIFMKKIVRPFAMLKILVSLLAGFIIFMSAQYATNYALYGDSPRLQTAAVGSFKAGAAEGFHTDENKILGQMGFNPFEDMNRSIGVFAHDPLKVTTLLAKGFFKRTFILYLFPNFGVFDPLYIVNPDSGYFFRFPVYMQWCGYILVMLGFLSVFVNRERPLPLALALSLFLYLSVRVGLLAVLNARYRGVLMPTFFLFLAYGMNFFYHKVRSAYESK